MSVTDTVRQDEKFGCRNRSDAPCWGKIGSRALGLRGRSPGQSEFFAGLPGVRDLSGTECAELLGAEPSTLEQHDAGAQFLAALGVADAEHMDIAPAPLAAPLGRLQIWLFERRIRPKSRGQFEEPLLEDVDDRFAASVSAAVGCDRGTVAADGVAAAGLP
jgi:hypothetical protein